MAVIFSLSVYFFLTNTSARKVFRVHLLSIISCIDACDEVGLHPWNDLSGPTGIAVSNARKLSLLHRNILMYVELVKIGMSLVNFESGRRRENLHVCDVFHCLSWTVKLHYFLTTHFCKYVLMNGSVRESWLALVNRRWPIGIQFPYQVG